jgi:DNA repair photolyase
MIGFDPRTAVPAYWSLKPEDTLGLVFWTKDPRNLVQEATLIGQYRTKIHLTVTGWEEVERGAPSLQNSLENLVATVRAYGPQNVTWRFSPVPLVADAAERFERIARVAQDSGLTSTYLSFLQPNDHLPETRAEEEKLSTLQRIAEVGDRYGIAVRLCQEDRLLAGYPNAHRNLGSGICAPPEDFDLAGHARSPAEGCGCVLMVDPFTFNESCGMGCQFCYAADKTLSPRKHNTTKKLKVLP